MEHPEMDMYAYERFLADGKTPFCGVDEAGRGPLAGRCVLRRSFCRRGS